MRPRGRLVEISATGKRDVHFDLVDFYHNESRLFGIDTLKRDLAQSAKILDAQRFGFESGAYRPSPIAETVSLTRVRDGYSPLAEGVDGRMVIAPQRG